MGENHQQPDLAPVDSVGIAEHTLRGEITRVVFTSEETGYSVIRMVTGDGAEQTVIGVLPGAYEGQGIEVTGVWEKHREHGLQLRTRAYRFILPSSPDGIRRYLASGLIPGIGPKLAELIVDHFGGRTLEILEHYSSRLTEIPALGGNGWRWCARPGRSTPRAGTSSSSCKAWAYRWRIASGSSSATGRRRRRW
jgi:ATP-dependent exoDNAse (exonuclease V) alpha subunit